MRRTPVPPRKVGLARGPLQLPRRTPLARQVAPRQPAQPRPKPTTPGSDIPQAAREAVAARSGGRCEAAIDGVCLGPAGNVHHRRRRGVGDDPHAVHNLLHLCGSGTTGCHGAAHRQPALAMHFGWIVSAYADPAAQPVQVRGRWVRLTGGGYEPADPPL
ncbi:hypothetical protein [Blastococcus sp. SYSU D00813]